uniref:Eukaryotic translation initiation factor 3 subunit L n=1 Tax=Gongylonema pulchrum TaxID=637853 RepID=A0A183E681_9BILA
LATLRESLVTPAVYPRLVEFLHFYIQSTGQKSETVNTGKGHLSTVEFPILFFEDTLGDEVVPEDVAQYLIYFKRMIDDENVAEIHNLYEHGFTDLTERYFQQRLWPSEEAVENVVGSDNRVFIILYKELYFRHVYSRMQRGPSLTHRYDSYQNYQELFSEILTSEERPLSLQLPNNWLWDIIDEFVYQFQAFCLYKANPAKRTPEEYEDLVSIEQNQSAWNIYPVLNILYSLLAKSQIDEQLIAIREGRNPDDVANEFGRSALYFKLGYFSLIGLLRTHGLYNTVPSCLVTLHYFVGFSHMMMRNYGEATKIFVNCLLYIQRTKNVQQQSQQQKKNFQYDVVSGYKKFEPERNCGDGVGARGCGGQFLGLDLCFC